MNQPEVSSGDLLEEMFELSRLMGIDYCRNNLFGGGQSGGFSIDPRHRELASRSSASVIVDVQNTGRCWNTRWGTDGAEERVSGRAQLDLMGSYALSGSSSGFGRSP